MVGVVGARDLPAEPSEEEFRLGLRSGLILCNVLNKIQPGAVSKVKCAAFKNKKYVGVCLIYINISLANFLGR